MDATVKRVMDRAEEHGELSMSMDTPRILALDIETAPALQYVWSLFSKGPLNHQMQVDRTEMLGWCAKWVGEGGEVFGMDRRDENMLNNLWFLLDEADFIVAHNGDRFDVKRINSEFLLKGFSPPSSYRQIDTLKMVKRCFGFDSNRLDYLVWILFGERKEKHDGFDTWLGCMRDDPKAWDDMMKYNAKDVVLLERLYVEIRAWDKSHPNVLLSMDRPPELPACTVCGSLDVGVTGNFVTTNAAKYPEYECNDCGAKMRSKHSIATTPLRKAR